MIDMIAKADEGGIVKTTLMRQCLIVVYNWCGRGGWGAAGLSMSDIVPRLYHWQAALVYRAESEDTLPCYC